MASKNRKKKKVRNKARDMFTDYYRTNREYEKENRRREKEEGLKAKGLRNLNTTEKTCIVIIVLGLVGIVIKYFVL